jgi:hypothetical protein
MAPVSVGHLVSSQFPWEVKFASDSPMEGDGFELLVPLLTAPREGFALIGAAIVLPPPTEVVRSLPEIISVAGGSRGHVA